MRKLDLKQVFRHLYKPSHREVVLVDVPRLKFLAIDGRGNPDGSPEFRAAMGALLAVSYTLKFQLKRSVPPRDYTVMPPEVLWWSEDSTSLAWDSKENWCWTLMVLQPEFIVPEFVARAVEKVRQRIPDAALARLRLAEFEEGRAVQLLHVGPYEAEGPALERMRQFAAQEGYAIAGKYHEIYLGDPRRTPPEKLKTILRVSVLRVGAVAGKS